MALPISILDLVPVILGETQREALRLARVRSYEIVAEVFGSRG